MGRIARVAVLVGCAILVGACLLAFGYFAWPYLPQSSTEVPRGYANPSLLLGPTRTISGTIVNAQVYEWTDAPALVLNVVSPPYTTETIVLNSNGVFTLANGAGPAPLTEQSFDVSSLIGQHVVARVRSRLPWMPGDQREYYAISAAFTLEKWSAPS